jgi:UDP-glucose 4-epimerase
MYLVTGGAGFIGSNVAEALVRRGDAVRIFDDFSSGKRENLAGFADRVEVLEGDLRDRAAVARAVAGVAGVFHQAALRSVPRSVDDPLATNDVNITGTLHLLLACRDAGVKRVVAASSSSVYGANEELPKREDQPLIPVSPYAASKLAGEHYCRIFSHLYGLETVSLRYFNVFGPRQDPESQYAAVVPLFIQAALDGTPLTVHGDGLQSRDFTYIDNVVEANLRAMEAPGVSGEAFNIACGSRYSLLDIVGVIERELGVTTSRRHTPPRPGDVRHTLADIGKAERMLGLRPAIGFEEGMARTVAYLKRLHAGPRAATACSGGSRRPPTFPRSVSRPRPSRRWPRPARCGRMGRRSSVDERPRHHAHHGPRSAAALPALRPSTALRRVAHHARALRLLRDALRARAGLLRGRDLPELRLHRHGGRQRLPGARRLDRAHPDRSDPPLERLRDRRPARVLSPLA